MPFAIAADESEKHHFLTEILDVPSGSN